MRSNVWVIACLVLQCALYTNTVYPTELGDLKNRYIAPKIQEPILNKNNEYRVQLGKTLFFDPRLSGSNWISCATCHNPAMGWSDGLPTAIGEGQNVLKRATPTIINAAFNHLQMWDGRFRSLEEQVMAPVGSKTEMNQNPEDLVRELKEIPGYVSMFKDAYPGRGINARTISMALASFERTIISSKSPFDRWVAGDANAISVSAQRGFRLFEGKAHCSTCHSGFNFTDDGFHNIGLKSDDVGRFAVKAVDVSKGAFKTPTLRNIAQTAPYMHNGAYKTLEEVIDHYIRGGDDKSNLSPNFKKADLSEREKQDLLSFLMTLTGEPVAMTYPDMPN